MAGWFEYRRMDQTPSFGQMPRFVPPAQISGVANSHPYSSPYPPRSATAGRVCDVCHSLYIGDACFQCRPPLSHPPVRAPGVFRPVVFKEPVYQAPVYQAPIYQAPFYQAPVYQAPVHQAPVYPAPTFTQAQQHAGSYHGAMAAVAMNVDGGLPAPGAHLDNDGHIYAQDSIAPEEVNITTAAPERQSVSLSPTAPTATAGDEQTLLDPQPPSEQALAAPPESASEMSGALLVDQTPLPAQNETVLDPHAQDPFFGLADNIGPGEEYLRQLVGLEQPAAVPDMDAQSQWMAYAKLEFEDGDFYMTTYAIELGRDLGASRIAQRHELEERERQEREALGLASVGDASYGSVKASGEGSMGAYHSHVSESGGIVGRTDEQVQLPTRHRKKGHKSRSTGSSRQPSVGDASEYVEPGAWMGPEAIQTGPIKIDTLLPDPNNCPLVPIHPPEPDSCKGISRRHARIEYNYETSNFELTVLGRNGVFLDDVHYLQNDVVPLQDKSRVQIGKVNFTFRLPNYPAEEGDEEEELGSTSGGMSFAFEDGRGDSIIADEESDADSEVVQRSIEPLYANGWDFDEDSDEDESLGEDEDEEEGPEGSDEAEEPVAKQPIRLKLKLSKPSKKDSKQNKSRSNVKHVKKPAARPQAASKAPQKTQAKEREQPQEKPKAKLVEKPKPQPKPVDKEKGKEKETSEPDGEPKEASNESNDKGKGKEAEKPKEPRDPALENIRNEAQLNGEGITIPGLPPGAVIPPKRKGPGRPPKDGIMSKREKSLLIKRAKLEAQGLDAETIEEMLAPKTTKPKENKDANQVESSKRNGGEGSGERKSGSPSGNADGMSPGDKKAAKAPKPPLSPSPPMREEDFTEEQLQRPPHNYVVMCHEVISESKQGALSLQQIYRAIQHKYPFYRFRQKTQGWQSSVRHNLTQHEAFQKTERDGKGFLWAIKPGVSIEKERKKKASPPPQIPPPGMQRPPYPQQIYHHGHPGHYPMPPHHGHAPYHGMPNYPHPPAPMVQPPPPRIPPSLNGVPPSLAANTGQTPSTYASPYVSPYGSGASSHPNPTTPRGPPHMQHSPQPPHLQHRPPYPQPFQNGAPPHPTGPSGQPPMQQQYSAHRPSPMPPAHSAPPSGSHTPPMAPPSQAPPRATSQAPSYSQTPTFSPNSSQPPPSNTAQAVPAISTQPSPTTTPSQPSTPPPWKPLLAHLDPTILDALVNFRDAFIASSSRPDRATLIDNSITRLYAAKEHHPKTSVDGEPGVMNAIRGVMRVESGLKEKVVEAAGATATAEKEGAGAGTMAVAPVAQTLSVAQPQPQPAPSPKGTGVETVAPVNGTADGSGNGNGNGAGAKRSAEVLGEDKEAEQVKKPKV